MLSGLPGLKVSLLSPDEIETFRAAPPVLDTPMVFSLKVPISICPKSTFGPESAMSGFCLDPAPVTATVATVDAPDFTCSMPIKMPATFGVNFTFTLNDPPGATDFGNAGEVML